MLSFLVYNIAEKAFLNNQKKFHEDSPPSFFSIGKTKEYPTFCTKISIFLSKFCTLRKI